MQLSPLDPTSPDAQALIAQSEALMTALYPSESNHFEPAANLRPPHGAFWGAWVDARLVGCGGVKHHAPSGEPAYGEIKRLFVLDSARGRGVARQLMARLEAELTARGVGLARLETGIHQPEALALYRRLGYRERGPFGDYAPDPLSAFFEKELTPTQM
ncbi:MULTISPECIES: GNAT family N-acetyltransferase [unclassified Roseateles]|uniref:GNAT family N-acetyltransferase n=1 Tax=unclassified Roseateles TaxID=2626991 RepID=UPI0006FD5DC2|nr:MULTISPECIES: GNAT family N-acetyltransferase [unclassified Roseateles]KQW51302.1 GCN5 family acetyltransferase [Pelomonas sp. Root405]KRA77534.1 GCN5 family acetyltransferase [Pelomonas sp. Root662]